MGKHQSIIWVGAAAIAAGACLAAIDSPARHTVHCFLLDRWFGQGQQLAQSKIPGGPSSAWRWDSRSCPPSYQPGAWHSVPSQVIVPQAQPQTQLGPPRLPIDSQPSYPQIDVPTWPNRQDGTLQGPQSESIAPVPKPAPKPGGLGSANSQAATDPPQSVDPSRVDPAGTSSGAKPDETEPIRFWGSLPGLAWTAAAALGVSTPVGLGVWAAASGIGAIAKRRRKRRRQANPAASYADNQRGPVVAIESPPPPQVVRQATEYVAYETNQHAAAYQWAKRKLVEKYPGANEQLRQLDSLIHQYISADIDLPKS